MGAPKNAIPLGYEDWSDPNNIPGIHCDCGFKGTAGDLLEDPEDQNSNSTMWCPQCGTSGWVYD